MNLRSFLAGITAAVMMMLGLVAMAPAMADDESCGAVIGMSVVRNTFHGSTLDTSGDVELIWHPGTTLGQWADPGATMWSNRIGHLNDAGKAEAGAFLDAWYMNVPEPTTTTVFDATTTTVEATTTTVEESPTTTLPACLPEEA